VASRLARRTRIPASMSLRDLWRGLLLQRTMEVPSPSISRSGSPRQKDPDDTRILSGKANKIILNKVRDTVYLSIAALLPHY